MFIIFLELSRLEAELKLFQIENEHVIGEYFKLRNQITQSSKEFTKYITNPQYILPFLNAGRLIKVICLQYLILF